MQEQTRAQLEAREQRRKFRLESEAIAAQVLPSSVQLSLHLMILLRLRVEEEGEGGGPDHEHPKPETRNPKP